MSAEPAAGGAGRYAPSPTGDLHLGNLRTALLAWLFARATRRRFVMRVEDLDRVRAGSADRQLADLAALGLDWDGPVVYSSARGERHAAALQQLVDAGLAYECYCTRREIAEAASAPHGQPVPDGAYPGTCRDLDAAQRAERRAQRPAALRLRADVTEWTVHDELHGEFSAGVDDLVLRRNDGAIAYNLAVVVDDADDGIDQVVRGDDLLTSAPRQAYLLRLLGLPGCTYAHVPLALNTEGRRLAKRDGAVTVADLAAQGVTPADILTILAASLRLAGTGEHVNLQTLLHRFDPALLPREPWVVTGGSSEL